MSAAQSRVANRSRLPRGYSETPMQCLGLLSFDCARAGKQSFGAPVNSNWLQPLSFEPSLCDNKNRTNGSSFGSIAHFLGRYGGYHVRLVGLVGLNMGIPVILVPRAAARELP